MIRVPRPLVRWLRRPGRLTRGLVRGALLAISTAVALLLAEGLARVTERPSGYVHEEPCDTAAYQLVPDERGFAPLPGMREYNGHGMRDRSYDLPPAEGTRRIVVLGDSVAYGPGVGVESIFDNQLEDRLSEDGAPVQAYNLGVPGYNTVQERAALEQVGLALDPELVMVVWTANDRAVSPTIVVTDDGLVSAYEADVYVPVLVRPPPRVEAWLVKRSALYRMGSAATARTWAGLRGDGAVSVYSLAAVANRIAMLDIADTARDHGAGVLFVLFPTLDDVGEDHLHGQTREFLEHHRLPVVDLAEVFAGMDAATLQAFPGDRVHPSVLACDLAAARVAEEVRARGYGMGLERERVRLHAETHSTLLENAELPLDGSLMARVSTTECDPLDRRAARFGDDRGDATMDGGDLRDLGVAVCGDELRVGLEVAPSLSTDLEVVISLRLGGVGEGMLVVPGDPAQPAYVRFPLDTVMPVEPVVERSGAVLRVTYPVLQLPGCSQHCEWHLGPTAVVHGATQAIVDDHRLSYRVNWPNPTTTF